MQLGLTSSVIIDATKQKGFTRKIADETLEGLKGKLKNNTTFRVAGNGFEFSQEVKAKE